jgi:hypothetical protein
LDKAVAAVEDLFSIVTGREPSVTPEMDAFSNEITVTSAKRDVT